MSTFHALGVPDAIASRLAAAGIHEPFPIQSAVIPDALAGRDVIGRAPTGAGKTLAFGIPLVSRVESATKRRPTGLVLAPTRELAEQIAVELRPLADTVGRRVVSIYGGVGYGHQLKALDRGADLVVACPGRLEDLLAMDAVELGDVGFLVVDEADRMSDMGFMPALRRIIELTGDDRQTLLFSATLDRAVANLSDEIQIDPVRHELGPTGPDLSAATHHFWTVDHADRMTLATQVVERVGSTMIFSRTRHGADRIAKRLTKAGVSAVAIHGGRSQNQRDRALRSFADNSVSALVATDVAARGIHVDDVAAVVHFDPPEDAAAYVHRSGRTARAGASGVVVSFVQPSAARGAKALQREVGIDVGLVGPELDELGTAPAPRPAPRGDVSGTAAGGRTSREDRRNEPRSTNGKDRHERTTHTNRRDRGFVRDDRISDRRNRRSDQLAPAGRSERQRSERHQGVGVLEVKAGSMQGTVKFFNNEKGYGFISREGGKDVFVHHSNIEAEGYKTLEEGQTVEFEIGPGRKGDEARNVRVV